MRRIQFYVLFGVTYISYKDREAHESKRGSHRRDFANYKGCLRSQSNEKNYIMPLFFL